ncbi:hypothetical protein JHK87_003713 [Glycine soja]|nr:hypothetical protein JHK87_003713 [Glycine soja]
MGACCGGQRETEISTVGSLSLKDEARKSNWSTITIAERNNASFLKIVSRKSLLFLFIMTFVLFIMSWFFVLRSTSSSHFFDHKLLPNSKLFSTLDGSKPHM